MTGAERRQQIVSLLKHKEGVTGQQLAQYFGVSRQVIVQDMAILRAEGAPILSTPRGYVYWVPASDLSRVVVAVRHGSAHQVVASELYALVAAGVTVVNVMVEHPLYGELVGNLNLRSPEDVRQFMADLALQGAQLLSSLTDGIHLHTLEGTRQQIDAARAALHQLGFLLGEPLPNSSR
jgi:transcriptional regulator of NAD metabolism